MRIIKVSKSFYSFFFYFFFNFSLFRMNESACDVELEKEIAQKAITDAERSKLPSCYNINLVTNAINSAPAEISKFLMNNITKPSSNNCKNTFILFFVL